MATIIDLKKSFMQMSFKDQYELIKKVQENRLIPKKVTKAKSKKATKKQLTFQELLVSVKNMHPEDKKQFMLDNGLV